MKVIYMFFFSENIGVNLIKKNMGIVLVCSCLYGKSLFLCVVKRINIIVGMIC